MALFNGRLLLAGSGLLLLAALGVARLPLGQLPQRLAAFRISLNPPPAAGDRLSSADLSTWADQWIVSAEAAARTIQGTDAVVLDPRTIASSRLTRAVPIAWPAFSRDAVSRRGLLLSDDQLLARKLEALGVSSDRPVLVAGDPKAWGEDGRIVWMLRTLGHPAAAMVDGGHSALAAALAAQNIRPAQPTSGSFAVQRDTTWSIGRDRLRELMASSNVVVVDSRSAAEYAGGTPHGEARGGHVPGAVHLHFKSLMDEAGYLLPRPTLLDRLAQAGITSDKTIVTYCTGGVRSAWLAVVLTDLGFSVKNYAGSMWEWSAADPAQYPLVQTN
ncbi:MAG: rhodanese-like domain-containing protein [Cyanobacteria bacterium P01_A01_bin.135]